mmetsp:Transcript_106421/g.338922  ORF Transcript_106421/g.338922 Transcript_106421/m.338922 type:complete len:779 (-) Transcript_106421:98-2434(-)
MGHWYETAATASSTTAASVEAAAAVGPVAVRVLVDLATLAPQMCDARLRVVAVQAAAEGLELCQQHAQRCLSLLVAALREPEAGLALCHDALWALNGVAKKGGKPVGQWMIDAGGISAIRGLLAAYHESEDLVRSALWLVYNLDGLRGLAGLLDDGGGQASLPEDALAAVAWVVYELAREREQACATHPPPEAGALLRVLVSIMGRPCQSHQVRWASCAALDALMKREPRIGALFCELGGAPLLVEVLRFSTGLGSDGEDLSRACAYAMCTLVDGSTVQAQALRDAGAPEALARLGVRGRGGLDEEAAVWALGQLSGLGAVLEAMARAPSSNAVLRSGVEVISQLAWHVVAPGDVARLPQVLGALVALLGHAKRPVPFPHCIAAIGSAACGLAPHAEPGRLPELDQAIVALLGTLRSEPPEDMSAAESAVEALGRVALLAPAWREGLKSCRATAVFAAHIDGGRSSRVLSKYCFWAAAALLGLPFVVHELRLHMRCAERVDAALCTIGDILDDDLENEYALRGAERCSEADVPSLLALVAEVMRAHSSDSEVQRHGCHCVGLLSPLVSPAAAPQDAATAVIAAARRHPCCHLVLQQACGALRALLGPRRGGPAGTPQPTQEGLEALAALLQREGASVIAERAILDFAGSGDAEVLENATATLAALSGVSPALAVLKEAGTGQVRSAGVKALFEFGCQQPATLCRARDEASTAVAAMLAESPEDEALRQSAALLLGLCGVSPTELEAPCPEAGGDHVAATAPVAAQGPGGGPLPAMGGG